MKPSFSLLLLLSFFLAVCSAYDYDYCAAPLTVGVTNTSYTLEFVQMVTRHGDRSTITLLPGQTIPFYCNFTTYLAPSVDTNPVAASTRLYRKNYIPGREPAPGNCYPGQLTPRGFNQHVTLGQNLRVLYIDTYNFLPNDIDQSIMYVRSTDIPRTLASAQGNSLGMYPPDPDVSSSAVPVIDMYTRDVSIDNMMSNSGACPRLLQLWAEQDSSPAYIAWAKQQAPLRQKLAAILGISVSKLPDWSGLLDAFQVLTCYGESYPGVSDELVQQIFANANWQWNFELNDTEVAYLEIGSFVVELVENIQAYINGQLDYKWMVFSGHDTTIGPLLAALQAYDGQWPPYASHVEFELWNDNSGSSNPYYVQVKYQGEPLLLNKCRSTMCPFSDFLNLVNPMLQINYAQACMQQ